MQIQTAAVAVNSACAREREREEQLGRVREVNAEGGGGCIGLRAMSELCSVQQP